MKVIKSHAFNDRTNHDGVLKLFEGEHFYLVALELTRNDYTSRLTGEVYRDLLGAQFFLKSKRENAELTYEARLVSRSPGKPNLKHHIDFLQPVEAHCILHGLHSLEAEDYTRLLIGRLTSAIFDTSKLAVKGVQVKGLPLKSKVSDIPEMVLPDLENKLELDQLDSFTRLRLQLLYTAAFTAPGGDPLSRLAPVDQEWAWTQVRYSHYEPLIIDVEMDYLSALLHK